MKEIEMFKAVSDTTFRKNKPLIAEEYHRLKGDNRQNKLFHNKREEVKA